MQSMEAYEKAKSVIPGGVNSPVRAFTGVGGTPIFFESSAGARVQSIDGKRYLDYVGSWGPMILGHNDPTVRQKVHEAVDKGLSFGAPTLAETALADMICQRIPSVEKVRLVNSGTEATMSAIRLARGFTKRDRIIKFEGCYHGHSDSLLIKAGSGALTCGVPSSPGVPAALAEYTINLPFNDVEALRTAFSDYGDSIAGVIVEPVAGNMNCIPGERAFLEALRHVCDESGALLIFDEVMTGFRVSRQGAEGYYGIRPDLCTMGKVIGGGMPVGAFGGRADVMAHMAPEGPVYQAGTLSGNPITVAAGLATLTLLDDDKLYQQLAEKTDKMARGLASVTEKLGVPACVQSVPGMFGLFFTQASKVSTFRDVSQCDVARYRDFFHALLKQGVYFAPSAYETGFMSLAHTDDDIECTLDAVEKALNSL